MRRPNIRRREAVSARVLRVLAWPAFANERSNPYTALLYKTIAPLGFEVFETTGGRDLLRRRPHVWHLHWPEWAASGTSSLSRWANCLRFLASLLAAKAVGAKLVWTAHNLEPHEDEAPRQVALAMAALVRLLDLHISLGPAARDATLDRYPRLRHTPCRVIPHGSYVGAYPDTVSRDEARQALDLAPHHRVCLFLGQIRPYKNVLGLMDAFGRVRGDDCRLVVAGSPSPSEHGGALLARAALDRRIRCMPGYVEPDRIQVFLRAADVMVLPYLETLNSGAAILALSFSTPVVAPSVAAFIDLRNEFGPRWVQTFEGRLGTEDLETALGLAPTLGTADHERLQACLARREWPVIAALTAAAFRYTCGAAGPAADASGAQPDGVRRC